MFLQQSISFLLLLLVSVKVADADTDNTPTTFSVGSQYEYTYSAEIVLKEVDTFHFSATVFLSGYAVSQCVEDEGLSIREELLGALNCTSVHVRLTNSSLFSIQAREHGEEIIDHAMNLSQWFSFYQRQDGLISKVSYPVDEHKQVLLLKKAVASSFSLRLHSYIRKKGTSKLYGGWTYRVPDLDHSGTHSASYDVKEDGRMVTYKKIKKDIENNHIHNKEIQIVKETGHIELVRVEDTAKITRSPPMESPSVDKPPPIKATGLSHINLIAKYSIDTISFQEPSNLILDSIIAQRVVDDPVTYTTAIAQIRSNLSQTHNCYPTSTVECVKTIRKIVNVIELMDDQDITQLSAVYLSCPLNKRRSHIEAVMDALGMCSRAPCEFTLVSFLNAKMMDQLAFHPRSFPRQLRNLTLSNMAVLALGSMSANLRDSDPLLSQRILSKLHRMTLPHDHVRYKRANKVKSRKVSGNSISEMRQSSLIHSLGNAGHEDSFNVLKSFVESEHAPSLLRRSAVHSLRGFITDEAADTILSAALVDKAEVVRYEATLQYQLHPRADSMADILSDFYNYTQAQQSPAGASRRRVRRFSIFDALSFHLQTPSFDWKKTIGSSDFGASLGIIIRNIMDLNIQPLNGRFEADIHDEAYFVANLGYLGDLANIYDETIGAVVSSIKEAITSFREVLGVNIDVKYIFDTLVQAVQELPFIIQDLVVSPTLRRILEQLQQLPFIQKGLMLIDDIKSLYNDVRSDVLMFYQEISDCVTVTLPWVGDTIKSAISTIGDSIEHFFRNPIISIRDVIVAIAQLRSAFNAVIDCKDIIVNAAKFEGAHVRGWMDLVNRLKEIYNTTIETKDLILQEAKEFSEIRNLSSFEQATGVNVTLLRMKAYSDLKAAFDKFIEPLAPLLEIVQPFIDAYTSAVNVVDTAIKAYEILRETYENVKNLIERLFGPKFNRNFPRQIRGEDGCEESTCECGYYPTTSGDPAVYKDGLQLEMSSGDILVAPTSGLYLRVPDNQLLATISTAGVNVEGGDQIGTVTDNPGGCDPNFIHFTVMTKSRGSTTDPNPFLQPRFLETPEWIQECNDYQLVVLGSVIREGGIVGQPVRNDMTVRGQCNTGPDSCDNPMLANNDKQPPNKSAYKPKYADAIGGDPTAMSGLLPEASANGPRGPLDRPIGSNLGKYFTMQQEEKYAQDTSSGFNIVVKGEGEGGSFNFSVNTIKVGQALDILKALSTPEVAEIITTVENTIEYLREALDCSNEQLTDPSLLDLQSIQDLLKVRGLPTQGDRDQLIAELIALPSDLCPSLQSAIPTNRWCSITEDCLTLKCAAALRLDFFQYSVSFSVTLDPCAPSITLQFQDLEKVIDLPDIYGGMEINIGQESVELLGIATVELALKLTRKDTNIYLDFTAHLCPPDESSEDYSHCFYSLALLASAGFQIPSPLNCNSSKTTRAVAEDSDVTSCGIKIPDFLNMTLGEFVTYIKDLGDSGSAGNTTNNLNQLMQDLRNVFLNELLNALISGKSPIGGDETDFPTTFDVCIKGTFKRQKTENFYMEEEFIFIGMVPVHFTFSLDGLYGLEIGAQVCFISMVANADVSPFVALVATGTASVSFGIAEAGIKITGEICNTHLPVQPSIGFKSFPLALRLRVDLNIIPLSITVSIYLKLTINLLFTSIEITIIDFNLFHWSTPTIQIPLLDASNLDMDDSPPLFSPIAEGESSRRRRATSSGATPCTVTQVEGRDYTNPAFILQVSVADDKSQAELTYSIGTYPGGTDVVDNERMNGNTALIAKRLIAGIPLYWTASASNSQGVSASTECSLDTYDMTLSTGRVDFNSYIFSSHPSKLIGECTIVDDTNILNQSQAIGYGPGPIGDQTVPFTPFEFNQYDLQDTMEGFFTIANKRLGVTAFKTTSGVSLTDCQADCLLFPTKCFSFNYASVLRICELINDIGADANIQFASDLQYSYYEKRGIGNHASFMYENLPLVHDILYFLNLYIVNELLYESYVRSSGMLIDFTVPEPGIINNASMNVTRHDGCSAAFNQRCEPIEYVTPLEYHRIIQDGPGSECIFNGPSIQNDMEYTRLNSFVSITFQGFHDDQSGIYAYAWYMGYEACELGALTPRDPNADSTSPLSDINQGRVTQHFEDGIYYITVQALNQVIFGGSGVLSLCHSTRYIIDTTPPIISNVTRIAYNENTNISTFFYEAWDDLSGLQQVELGAGLTISDIAVLAWTPIFINRTATLTHKIDVPDGTRAFIRIRATNHVDLSSASYAPRPIIVDRTPPIPGVVLDGDGPGNTDWKYQASGSVLCAKWRNFVDPQSGISAYRWGAGTAPGLSNTVPFTGDLPSDQDEICRSGLDLKHNTTYYSTVIAFNADTDHPRNISASSNGVLVDLTNPIAGFVKDGLDPNSNLYYTYIATTVQAVWGNFSDPESGIAQYNATIYKANVLEYLPADAEPNLNQNCPAASNNSVIPIEPPFTPPADVTFRVEAESTNVALKQQINMNTFEFSHGDYIRTTITGIDGATRQLMQAVMDSSLTQRLRE
ncbi:hypothetical protein LOD99_10427 [Oopsacas minuta]|uniref:Apple domain-containing protein n=1 Tax=Oopsacas minuta TaxID=111878 RepID=A0AAV7KFX5_9METZ|nr:hypothetical protein LOD99_10427 [Oopsacas minuta]